jgi:hypothetical protein
VQYLVSIRLAVNEAPQTTQGLDVPGRVSRVS